MTDISHLSFEESMRELENIVRSLEEGRLTLDQAMKAYERGVSLKKICEMKLREARTKIEKITLTPEGTVTKEEIEIETTNGSLF